MKVKNNLRKDLFENHPEYFNITEDDIWKIIPVILSLRYREIMGLLYNRQFTLKMAGQQYSITGSRIRQIRNSALRKIYRHFDDRKI